jgi:hypothetical protein
MTIEAAVHLTEVIHMTTKDRLMCMARHILEVAIMILLRVRMCDLHLQREKKHQGYTSRAQMEVGLQAQLVEGRIEVSQHYMALVLANPTFVSIQAVLEELINRLQLKRKMEQQQRRVVQKREQLLNLFPFPM